MGGDGIPEELGKRDSLSTRDELSLVGQFGRQPEGGDPVLAHAASLPSARVRTLSLDADISGEAFLHDVQDVATQVFHDVPGHEFPAVMRQALTGGVVRHLLIGHLDNERDHDPHAASSSHPGAYAGDNDVIVTPRPAGTSVPPKSHSRSVLVRMDHRRTVWNDGCMRPLIHVETVLRSEEHTSELQSPDH